MMKEGMGRRDPHLILDPHLREAQTMQEDFTPEMASFVLCRGGSVWEAGWGFIKGGKERGGMGDAARVKRC